MSKSIHITQGRRPAVAGLLPSRYGLRMVHRMSQILAVAGFAFLTVEAFGQNPNSIIFSKHNLSVSSPGDVHATTESDICIFCHTPHNATGDGPLWNHQMSSAAYLPYTSGTLKAAVGQPTGSSRLCLSCHDGTVALGMVRSRSGGIAMNSATMPVGDNNLGTDLSVHHPVSFTYDSALVTADGHLRDPNTLVLDVRLDRSGQVQCTSCHDPHNNQYGSFLVMDNTAAGLCLTCHNFANWASASHAISSKPLPPTLVSLLAAKNGATHNKVVVKSPTVSSVGCDSCHVSHAAGTRQELLRFSTPEMNCVPCHSSEGPGQNVALEFNKNSAHPILQNVAAHTPQENPVNPAIRHVTCVDCHNPHASSRIPGSKAGISGALASVVGVSAGGSVLRTITHEYELCYRCHGDSGLRGPARVTRQFVETNTRREFNPGNISFHPVEAAGKNSSVPSLIPPLTTSSTMNCGDCHNNDQGPDVGGSGAKGPHGSAFVPILERMLLLTDGTAYNPGNFALCYKCHSSSVVDSSQASSWAYHQKHIEDYHAACTTCHDSHAAGQPHLINFNTTYVQPLNGTLRYASTGMNHGICTLTCHDGSGQNKAHNATSY